MSVTTVKKQTPVEPALKSRQLKVERDPGRTEDRQFADLLTEGQVTNATTALRFAELEQGEVSLTDLVASLHTYGEAVNRGDLSAAERMLNSQAVALNAIFGELARRAAMNMGACVFHAMADTIPC